MLGYTLLNSANLHSDMVDLIKATCSELKFKIVKVQLEKIALGKFPSSQSNGMANKHPSFKRCSTPPSIKVEEVFYGHNEFNFSFLTD